MLHNGLISGSFDGSKSMSAERLIQWWSHRTKICLTFMS